MTPVFLIMPLLVAVLFGAAGWLLRAETHRCDARPVYFYGKRMEWPKGPR